MHMYVAHARQVNSVQLAPTAVECKKWCVTTKPRKRHEETCSASL